MSDNYFRFIAPASNIALIKFGTRNIVFMCGPSVITTISSHHPGLEVSAYMLEEVSTVIRSFDELVHNEALTSCFMTLTFICKGERHFLFPINKGLYLWRSWPLLLINRA